jgi:hypothetical protein
VKKKKEIAETAGRGRKADGLLLRDTGFRGTPYTNSLSYDSDIYLSKDVTMTQRQGEWSTSNLTTREVRAVMRLRPGKRQDQSLPGRFFRVEMDIIGRKVMELE